MEKQLSQLAMNLAGALTARGYRMATAESCTGGGVAQTLTSLPGSSAWFDRAYVTYSNQAKMDMLGVSEASLADHGAVSREVVEEMVQGVLAGSTVDLAVAISGIAGPGGAVEGKPVGTVWLAWMRRGGIARAECFRYFGDRDQVRNQAVVTAMEGLLVMCE